MRKILYFTFIGLASLVFTACETNTPQEPIPESFPKKQLLEGFVSQKCGYCPYGMDCVAAFIGNDSNWITVIHHAGYQTDHFTAKGSSSISSALNVNGTPNISINRTKTSSGAGKKVVFHPGYLDGINKSQFASTTYASVVIANSYNAANRVLKINVSGALSSNVVPVMRLTVLVKESGMIDTQADYYDTSAGWQEYRHTNAVRAFLTGANGDELTIRNRRYSEQYTITLDDKWVPENCMVVAFLTEEFQPVVQAEQEPAVSGTKGGADITHGGITQK